MWKMELWFIIVQDSFVVTDDRNPTQKMVGGYGDGNYWFM